MTTYADVRLVKLSGEFRRLVIAEHWRSDARSIVGEIQDAGAVGWTAKAYREQGRAGIEIGLYPDARAAAEALFQYYGFESIDPAEY